MRAVPSEPLAVSNDRMGEVKRRLKAAEAMQDAFLSFGDRGRALADHVPDKAYAGVLESVRRRFEEAEALQKSLRSALSDELVRTRHLQAQMKERPAVLSPRAARELESLRQEMQELRAERDTACSQCRLQAQEISSLSSSMELLRHQLQARNDERRELVSRLSSCLGSYLVDCDLSGEELQRSLEAITATRDAALQSAQHERESIQILKQQLASMRAERDEAQVRLQAEEQRWSSKMGELASAESRVEEASEQALARRRSDEETLRQTAARCTEAEAAKKQLQEQLVEERASSDALRVEVQSLSRCKQELQMELERSQAMSRAEELYDLEGQQDLDRLQRQLFKAKQEIDSLRVRTQVKESLLEQTEGELQKNVRRLGEMSAEKAQLQWEAAEQGKSELQLRQRLQIAEAKLLEAVRENRAEGEASFLLGESKKQLATLEDSKRSLMEGLEWEKAEVQRLKAELNRLAQERQGRPGDLCRSREVELVEAESKSQTTLRRLQRECSELKASLEDERAARHHLEAVAWPQERARLEEDLARERHCLLHLQEDIQVEQRLRQEAEDALAEVERRLGSVEVEQQKICLVETDRAKNRAELLRAREEILDLTAKLEVERHRVRKLEAARSGEGGREVEAREQSDLKALRTLLSSTMRERDEALEKALRLQGVNRSVEELHDVLAKAVQDREKLNMQLDQQQQDFVTLQSTLDMVEQLRAEIPSPASKQGFATLEGRGDILSPSNAMERSDGAVARATWTDEAQSRAAPATTPKDLVVVQAAHSPRSPSTSMVSTTYGTPQRHRQAADASGLPAFQSQFRTA